MPLSPSKLMPSLLDFLDNNQDWAETLVYVHPVSAPQNAPTPWLAFKLNKEGRDYDLFGATELKMAEVTFTFGCPDYKQGHGLANLLLAELNRKKGPMGDVVLVDVFFINSRDGESKDEVLGLYTVICDVSVWYTDA